MVPFIDISHLTWCDFQKMSAHQNIFRIEMKPNKYQDKIQNSNKGSLSKLHLTTWCAVRQCSEKADVWDLCNCDVSEKVHLRKYFPVLLYWKVHFLIWSISYHPMIKRYDDHFSLHLWAGLIPSERMPDQPKTQILKINLSIGSFPCFKDINRTGIWYFWG